jgi:hypothetical protein
MQNKKNSWRATIATLFLVLTMVTTAQAGSFRFNSIDFSLGGSLLMLASLVGLGNDVAEVTLTGYGTVTALCQNKGGQQAPGRNPISVAMQETGLFVSDNNGRSLVRVIAPDPTAPQFEPSPTPKEAGCPNGNWNVVGIVDGSTNWTAASVLVKDSLGQVQIDLFFTCKTTFSEDGLATGVTCQES